MYSSEDGSESDGLSFIDTSAQVDNYVFSKGVYVNKTPGQEKAAESPSPKKTVTTAPTLSPKAALSTLRYINDVSSTKTKVIPQPPIEASRSSDHDEGELTYISCSPVFKAKDKDSYRRV